jgi:hypothetical protein
MRNLLLASAAAATALGGLGLQVSPAQAQAGSYVRTCRNIQSQNGMLTAECADEGGRFHVSSLPFTHCHSEVSNINGMLSCNGAVASGGEIVGGDRRRRDRDDAGAGAFVGGAIAGALGAGAPPPPPPPPGPPPAWGQPGYGDPHADWRYAQGGWGYGHRPGEWVPIRDRAPWLEERIRRAVEAGRISPDAGRDLHRSVDRLEDMEAGMMRDGLYGPQERADLDRRWDDLAGRFRYEQH